MECVLSFNYDWNRVPRGAFAIATIDDARELGWAIEHWVAEAGYNIRDYPEIATASASSTSPTHPR